MATLKPRSVIAAACLVVVASSAARASAAPPPASGSTPVSVQAGTTTSAIDGALNQSSTQNGELSGRLVDPGHGNPPPRQVYIYSSTGDQVARLKHLQGGSFSAWVPPSHRGYAVCVYSRSRYVAKCLPNVAWNYHYGAPPPSGARYVPVSAGEHADVGDVKLHWGGRIAGTVRNKTGDAVDTVAYATSISHPRITRSSVSHLDGTYKIDRLLPSPKGWRVCFEPNSLDNLVRACHGGAIWNAGPLPHDAKPVHARAGHTTGHINAVLPTGGSVAGVVRSATTGKPLDSVRVFVYDAGGHEVSLNITDKSGRYTVSSLATRRGYRVCAAPMENAERIPAYFGNCYRGSRWDETDKPNGGKVAVHSPHTKHGVNLRLAPAATIKGIVFDEGGDADTFATVYAFDSSGAQVGTTETGRDGYRVTGLASGTYFVCSIDGLGPDHTELNAGFAPACYGDAPWRGGEAPVPSGATPVHVTAGDTATGKSITLPPGGTITGKVRDADSGQMLRDEKVSLYDADSNLIDTTTASADHGYQFEAVQPDDGYQVCFSGASASVNGKPGEFAYQGSCYQDAAWPH